MSLVIMNTFYVAIDKAHQFEERCSQPHERWQDVPGLEDFRLLRGQACDGRVPYVAHSVWRSKEAVEAWKQSERFMQSRHTGRLPASLLLDRPRRQCFEIVSPNGDAPLLHDAEETPTAVPRPGSELE